MLLIFNPLEHSQNIWRLSGCNTPSLDSPVRLIQGRWFCSPLLLSFMSSSQNQNFHFERAPVALLLICYVIEFSSETKFPNFQILSLPHCLKKNISEFLEKNTELERLRSLKQCIFLWISTSFFKASVALVWTYVCLNVNAYIYIGM